MTMLHPSPRDLEDFVLGRLDLPQNHRIVRHLLTGCHRCRGVTAQVWGRLEQGLRAARGSEMDTPAFGASRYEAVIDRAISNTTRRAAQADRERAQAARLYEELARHPVPRQITLVRNSRRFRSWALAELLLEESFSRRFDEPSESVGLAEVGLEVAERAPEELYGGALVNDLRGRAWAYLGNARRVVSDLSGAAEALQEARGCLAQGTGDPLDRALVLRFRAHLEVTRRRFDSAHGLYDQALQLYRRCEESDAEAMVLLDKGFAYATDGRPDLAAPMLQQGLRQIDWHRHPRRVLAARHNLVDTLNDSGRSSEALRRLEELRPEYRALGDRMNLLKLRWLEGKILTDLDRGIEAEHALLDARRGLVEAGVGFDAALVALDLAALYVQQGRPWRVRRLAEEILPVFDSRRAERETLAALVAFQRAARLEQVTADMVRELATRLRSSRG